MRSSSQCRVIGASVAILARRSKQANLHDSSMQTNAARSGRNPPGTLQIRDDRTRAWNVPRIHGSFKALNLKMQGVLHHEREPT